MSDNTSPFPEHPPTPAVPLLQKLGNAVNMFGMAVANDDHKVMDATKKHLIEIINTIHPDHEAHSPIIKPTAG